MNRKSEIGTPVTKKRGVFFLKRINVDFKTLSLCVRQGFSKVSTQIKFPVIMSIFFLSALPFSCSLQYNQTIYAEDHIPELQFTNAEFTRYENFKRKVQLKAEQLEQYKDTSNAYAQTVNFFTWEDSDLDTEGSCQYLSINSKDQIYTLFNDILIKNYSQDLELKARNLRWNSNTEQLTAGVGETVSLRRKGLTLEGSGFAASGITRSFSFDYDVEGSYDDNPEDSSDEAGIENLVEEAE